MEKINKNNFFESTRANWKECAAVPKRKPDFVSTNKFGEVSSAYWYTNKGVIRLSNHWSRIYGPGAESSNNHICECQRVAYCFWVLKTTQKFSNNTTMKAGYAEWGDFKFNHVRLYN